MSNSHLQWLLIYLGFWSADQPTNSKIRCPSQSVFCGLRRSEHVGFSKPLRFWPHCYIEAHLKNTAVQPRLGSFPYKD